MRAVHRNGLCERSMAERIVSMHVAHRSGKEVVDGFLSRPTPGGGPPEIVLVHGYRGLDDGQRAVSRRFAQAGSVCLSHDLFRGKTYHTLEDCALRKTSLDIPTAVHKIIDHVPYSRKLPWVGKKKLAVLGFCVGGRLVLYTHASLNDSQTDSSANWEAAAKSVAKTTKWLKKFLLNK